MNGLSMMVKEIKRDCLVYEASDVLYIVDGYKLKASQPICIHALVSLMPYYVALRKGVAREELGLGKDRVSYVQCLDPCEYNDGGTVVFETSKE